MSDECPDWPEALAQRYIEAGYWREQTFFGAISRVAEVHSDHIALTDADGSITYENLISAATRLANGLSDQGIRRGDNVVMQFTNRIRFVEALLALFRLGARPILALPAHRQFDILKISEVARPRAFITEDARSGFDYRMIAREFAERIDLPLIVIDGDAQEFQSIEALYIDIDHQIPEPNWRDVACFQLSGGTTGVPKLIPRRHMEYLYNATASAVLCEFDQDTVYLVALPAAHNFPMCCPGFIGALFHGGRAVLTPDPSPDACFQLIGKEKVTVTALVPSLAMVWAEAAAEQGAEQLASLRLLQVGGAKLGSQAASRVLASLGCSLQQVFGMAEGLLCYTRLDDHVERILDTQGRPLCPDDEIRVVDERGNSVGLNQIGSLLTRGPYTISANSRKPESARLVVAICGMNCRGFTSLKQRTPLHDGGCHKLTKLVEAVSSREGKRTPPPLLFPLCGRKRELF